MEHEAKPERLKEYARRFKKGWRATVDWLSKPAASAVIVVVAVSCLLAAHIGTRWMTSQAAAVQAKENALGNIFERSQEAVRRLQSDGEILGVDLDRFKADMINIVESKKTVYEVGLMLQEERRLLEKQWDILITHLRLDGAGQRILVMRGDQPVESYPVIFGIPQTYGDPKKGLPDIIKIVSKERFAHPERPKMEKVGDQVLWNPPQVGESVRSNALGEYVMFTDSDLVLHGPPAKLSEHEAFPHSCLALPAKTAKNLYQKCFIGTKISVSGAQ